MTDPNMFTFTFLSKEDIRIQNCIHLSKEFNHREYNADLVYWRKLATFGKPQYEPWKGSFSASNLYVNADSLYYDLGDESIVRGFMDELYDEIINFL